MRWIDRYNENMKYSRGYLIREIRDYNTDGITNLYSKTKSTLAQILTRLQSKEA